MKKLFLFLLLACTLTFAAAAQTTKDQATPQKPAMANHHQHMQALLDKVNSTWKEAETATTAQAKESALKAHGTALADLNAAHQKMAAAGDQEMQKMCQEMMAKHEAAHPKKAPK